MIIGACLCETVRWQLEGEVSIAVNCHCSMCRRHHGTAYSTMGVGPASGFHWLSGEPDVVMYPSSGQGRRYFCKHCGSKVPGTVPDMDMAFVLPGQVDGDPGFRPQMHIFAGSKAPWHTITDLLPQHTAYPPGWGEGGIDQPDADKPMSLDGRMTGRCLCGDVAFEVQEPPLRMFNCHCSRCRRSRGGAHATNLFYPMTALRWLRGENKIHHYALPGAKFFGTAFCERCGSFVPRIVAGRNAAVVPAGSLDGDPGIRPTAHVFVGSKAPWFEITDATPQFEAMPAG
jgi:hypothetical protein